MSDTATNSAVCRRIPLTVNSRTLKFIYSDRPSETIWNREDLPQICFGKTVIFCFTFLDEANLAITFFENDSFTLAADADFIHGEDPLMLFAGPECVNLPGDWDDTDPLHGKISIRVNCNTVGFEQKIGSAEDLIVRMEVRRIFGNFQTVLHADAIARNTVFLNEHSPEMAAPEYYTAAQSEQLFAGFSNENEAAHNALEDKIKSVAGSVAEIQLTADSASANSAVAQSTADTALANAAVAQTAANSKLTAPVAAGTAGQVLTLDENGTAPVWSVPKGGLTKWGAWEDRSSDTTYTAGTNGWIRVNCELLQQGDNVSIRIDSDTVFALGAKSADLTDNFIYTFPVFAGQTYRISYPAGRGLAYFAPCV